MPQIELLGTCSSDGLVMGVAKDMWKKIPESASITLNKYFEYSLFSWLIRLIHTEQTKKIQIVLLSNPLFAISPKTYNIKDYPLSPNYRETIELDLTTTQHGVDDKKVAIPNSSDTIYAGNLYWHGENGTTLSWKGSPGYLIQAPTDKSLDELTSVDPQITTGTVYYTAFSPYVYESGEIIYTAPLGELVVGSCYYDGSLVVITRRNSTTLAVYKDSVEKDLTSIGLYNGMWSFKSDGSEGVSYFDNRLYILSISKDTCKFTSSVVNLNSNYVSLNIAKTVDEKLPDTPPDLSGCMAGKLGSIPSSYASLSDECKAKWDAYINYQAITNTNTTITATTPKIQQIVVGIYYNNKDLLIPLYANINIDVKHNYQTILTTQVGEAIIEDYLDAGEINIPTPVIVGSVITINSCDNSKASLNIDTKTIQGADPFAQNCSVNLPTLSRINETQWKFVTRPCYGTFTARLTTCNGKSSTSSFTIDGSPHTLSASHNPFRKNDTVSVIGGVGPFEWDLGGMTGTISTDTRTFTRGATDCPSSKVVTVSVRDTSCCGVAQLIVYIAGSWVNTGTGPSDNIGASAYSNITTPVYKTITGSGNYCGTESSIPSTDSATTAIRYDVRIKAQVDSNNVDCVNVVYSGPCMYTETAAFLSPCVVDCSSIRSGIQPSITCCGTSDLARVVGYSYSSLLYTYICS